VSGIVVVVAVVADAVVVVETVGLVQAIAG
jgi:hypothetical protein